MLSNFLQSGRKVLAGRQSGGQRHRIRITGQVWSMGWSMENWWKLTLKDVDFMFFCKDSKDIYSIAMTPKITRISQNLQVWISGQRVDPRMVRSRIAYAIDSVTTKKLRWLQGTLTEPWRDVWVSGKSSNEVMQKDEMFATSTPTEVHMLFVWQDINIQSMRDQWKPHGNHVCILWACFWVHHWRPWVSPLRCAFLVLGRIVRSWSRSS